MISPTAIVASVSSWLSTVIVKSPTAPAPFTKFNVPISKDLDSMDAWMMDCFTVIENEIQKISNHERKKNGS